jgi:methylated-DNA-[protein]-cysteine S-methyltransferase
MSVERKRRRRYLLPSDSRQTATWTDVDNAVVPVTARSAATYFTLESPLGDLVAFANTAGGLTGLYFLDGYTTPVIPAGAAYSQEAFEELHDQLAGYFAGETERFDVPIVLDGSPFQRSVWQAVRAIPYGATYSYGQIAKELGNPRAARAVGAANAHNPVSLVVPCHRLLGACGELTGYAGGLDRKRSLLRHEATFVKQHTNSRADQEQYAAS